METETALHVINVHCVAVTGHFSFICVNVIHGSG